jgi:hypothetical protein
MAAVRFRFADDVHHVCEIIGKTCNAMAACRGNAKLSRVGFAWRRDWNRAVSRHPDQMPMPPPRDAALLGGGARLVIGSLANRRRAVTEQRHSMLDVGVMRGQLAAAAASSSGRQAGALSWRSTSLGRFQCAVIFIAMCCSSAERPAKN